MNPPWRIRLKIQKRPKDNRQAKSAAWEVSGRNYKLSLSTACATGKSEGPYQGMGRQCKTWRQGSLRVRFHAAGSLSDR